MSFQTPERPAGRPFTANRPTRQTKDVSTTPDLNEQIVKQAAKPSASSTAGQSATARPIGELIDAQVFDQQRKAMSKRRRGARFTKFIPGGPLSDGGRASGAQPFDGGV